MNDLIYRNDAIDALAYFDEKSPTGKTAQDIIISLPSAQPEIIYCKDCLQAIKDGLCGGYWCNGKAVTSNHYCGYAERRTDGSD